MNASQGGQDLEKLDMKMEEEERVLVHVKKGQGEKEKRNFGILFEKQRVNMPGLRPGEDNAAKKSLKQTTEHCIFSNTQS